MYFLKQILITFISYLGKSKLASVPAGGAVVASGAAPAAAAAGGSPAKGNHSKC